MSTFLRLVLTALWGVWAWLAVGAIDGAGLDALTLALAYAGLALSGIVLAVLRRRSADGPSTVLFAGLALSAGPAGALTALFAQIFHGLFKRGATPFEEWHRMIFLRDETERRDYRTASARRAGLLTAYTDVFAFGRIEEKRTALERIAREFRPALAPALRLALRDPVPSVRVQAAAVIAELDAKGTERATRLRDAAEITGVGANWSALGRHLEDEAATGLYDRDRSAAMRSEAIEAFGRALEADGEDPRARAALGRLLLAGGEAEAALAWFDQAAARQELSLEDARLRLDALLSVGRLEDVRRGLTRVPANDPVLGETRRLLLTPGAYSSGEVPV